MQPIVATINPGEASPQAANLQNALLALVEELIGDRPRIIYLMRVDLSCR